MAAGDPSLPPEEQCPQLSTTVSSPVIDEEIPGLPEPREEAGPPPPSARPKRKRDLSSDSEDDLAELLEPDPEPVWSVETLSGLRMKLKRRHLSTVRPEHHKVFTRLLEDPEVKKFLAWDKTLRVSDKYLLSMVIAYFSRAGLFSWQYRPIHFFLALSRLTTQSCGCGHEIVPT
ncbi:speedy protein E4A-like isoform X2 [Cricetulus griseus]|uniref:Speedy protein E4A-like isoform X2 n=1 Tax=Cricetulus griseus TaxID=10029 RepID=A0A9J7FY99_CRIGR|nr:speedy protein E4A-like isoform X2 [Cricetulus griseus]XP_027296742.1 speedy protein E4A-like isoform X2 [Cricetulus griseus]